MKILAYVIYVILNGLEPKADVAIVESVQACKEWHIKKAEELNKGPKFGVVEYDCVDLGIES